MTLDVMLKKDAQAVRLFSNLPTFAEATKTYQPKGPEQAFKTEQHADGSVVEKAFGYWCKAFIQKENKQEKEVIIPNVVVSGIMKGTELGYINEEEAEILLENVDIIWKTRSDFINGKEIDEDALLKGCIVLAHCEETARTNKKPKKHYRAIRNYDWIELQHLCEATRSIARMFRTEKGIVISPSFGEYAKKTGGTHSDYIIGNMLVDIQSSKQDHMKKEYVDRLFAHYLLSKYDPDFPCEIQQIGVFFPRFKKLVYIDIEAIEKQVNVPICLEWFREILDGNGNRLTKMSYKDIKKSVLR